MDNIIHAGFESATLSFIRDLTVDELIELTVEHVGNRCSTRTLSAIVRGHKQSQIDDLLPWNHQAA